MRSMMFAAVLLAAAAIMPHPAAAAEKIKVVAAENFYGDLASQIGGDHIEITSILSNPEDDPHLFESSPSTARALSTAAIVVYNGADYDPWMDKLLSASAKPDRKAIVAAELTGHKAGDNPHLWYDLKTFPAVATALAAELEKRDATHAADYKANLAKFEASFSELTKQVDAIKTKYKDTQVTATEPVFGYMADALGLKMLNQDFQTAIMNDSEPSPSQVVAFENSLKDGSAKILFYNNQVTDETTKRLLQIARDHKVAVVGVTETMPAGTAIQAWFDGQLGQVDLALSGLTQ